MNAVTRLIIQKWSVDAIPAGGGLVDGIKAIRNLADGAPEMKKAAEWVTDAIQAVRDAREPNPWKAASDEEIATEILGKISDSRHDLAGKTVELPNCFGTDDSQ